MTESSNDLKVKLNEAENKIADTIINKTQREKVSEKVPHPKKTIVITKKRKKTQPKTGYIYYDVIDTDQFLIFNNERTSYAPKHKCNIEK